MNTIIGFEPILPHNPTLLLLGSMPGVASLAKAEYYGHVRNQFWPLISAVLGENMPCAYAARIAMLRAHGIALWDSIHACSREGSLDQSIRDAEPNDIMRMIHAHASIRAVAFNGTLAERVYDRHFERLPGIAYMRLPSSSPVPQRIYKTMEDKLKTWMVLREYII